jgi:hypothetical protein
MNNSLLNRVLTRVKHLGPLQNLSPSTKTTIRKFVDRVSEPSAKQQLLSQVSQTNTLLCQLLYEQALSTPRAQEAKRLLRHGFKVYSQHDEDGIIEEIFRRIGATNRFFVEFGVGDGLENCTTYCLLKQWSGVWIDGSAYCYEEICKNFSGQLAAGVLKARYAFITAENIEQLFRELQVPQEFDFLSIDIDYNDFWIWKAIQAFSPRVVAIEYNASLKQTASCTVPYSTTRGWQYTNYFGSSLKALEKLGQEKGYSLVGCNYTGVTAFFVRNDLLGDHFLQPYTSENHFEPPRYYIRMPNGHPADFGPMVSI